MSCKSTPEYFTLVGVDCCSGGPIVYGIFESLDAAMYRLKRFNTSCGDEYHIECFHLSTFEAEYQGYQDYVQRKVMAENKGEDAAKEPEKEPEKEAVTV